MMNEFGTPFIPFLGYHNEKQEDCRYETLN